MEVYPAVGGFDVIALDAEGGGIGICEGEGGNQEEEKFCLFHIAYGFYYMGQRQHDGWQLP